MQYSPQRRLTATQALDHPYFNEIKDGSVKFKKSLKYSNEGKW